MLVHAIFRAETQLFIVLTSKFKQSVTRSLVRSELAATGLTTASRNILIACTPSRAARDESIFSLLLRRWRLRFLVSWVECSPTSTVLLSMEETVHRATLARSDAVDALAGAA